MITVVPNNFSNDISVCDIRLLENTGSRVGTTQLRMETSYTSSLMLGLD
jgi:hypothetical protein